MLLGKRIRKRYLHFGDLCNKQPIVLSLSLSLSLFLNILSYIIGPPNTVYQIQPIRIDIPFTLNNQKSVFIFLALDWTTKILLIQLNQ